MVLRALVFFTLSVVSMACAHAGPKGEAVSCVSSPENQATESARLKQLAAEDQSDRHVSPIDWTRVTPRDIRRRIEVGEIFARGCLQSAEDYGFAATVYQHGDTADHAYQAFLWSKRAVELGDQTRKWWMGAALDRYLMRMGHKQLFATQYSKPFDSTCLCLEPVEESFPDSMRVDYIRKTLADAEKRVAEVNAGKPECAKITYCAREAKPTPRGTVLGFW